MELNAYNGLSFESRNAAIEHEDGFDAVVEQLRDPAKEAQDVSVDDSFSFTVPHSFLELCMIGKVETSASSFDE